MFEMMPFGRQEHNLFNYLDHMEKSFFGGLNDTVSQFRTDVLDKGDKYVLEAELPGFKKEDIHIDLNGDTLTIRAEHTEEKEEKEKEYVRRERKYGSYSRSFDVSGIQADKIGASYKDGILELELPKAQPAPAPVSHQIEIQ